VTANATAEAANAFATKTGSVTVAVVATATAAATLIGMAVTKMRRKSCTLWHSMELAAELRTTFEKKCIEDT